MPKPTPAADIGVDLAMIILLMACIDGAALPQHRHTRLPARSFYVDGYTITRFVDSEMGVVCYMSHSVKRANMGCAPIGMEDAE